MLHRNFSGLCGLLSSKQWARRSLYTNGSLIGHYFEEIRVAFDRVRISIDAGTADTYAKIHGVHSRTFGRILKSVERLAHLGREVDLSMVATHESIDEIPDLIRVAKGHGARAVLIKPVLEDNFPSQTPALPTLHDLPSKTNSVNFLSRVPAHPAEYRSMPALPVTVAAFTIGAMPDGSLTPCCHRVSQEWQIGKVGESLDRAFRASHERVLRRYVTEVHSCRVFEAWRWYTREDART
ncbi:hypothetical protein GCM10009836_20420 [Pseudonocardia ailaonensis]|uniref:Radical SAM core domain-containing protein n=2 Tax=Pseudonocardia ailaonensis TaxID=367279 RepID=A0ABN2MZB6_9PSEU